MRIFKTITALLLCLLMVMPVFALAADGAEKPDDSCEHEEKDWVWIIDQAATCTEDGTRHRICTICQKEFSWNDKIDALNHEWVSVPAVAPTCETNGNEAYWQCKKCGLYSKDEAGNELTTLDEVLLSSYGHDYGEPVETPATCVKEGKLTYTCSHNPNHTYTESIPTIAHADNDGDGNCDMCGMGMNRNNKTGIAGFFAKIGMFFRNIFWFFNELLK